MPSPSTIVLDGLGSTSLVMGGLGGLVVSATTVPNPAETTWTIGATPGSGAIATLSVVQGFAVIYSTTLYNAGEVVAFASDATLDAVAWPGGDEAAVIAPTVAWVSSSAGTLTLAISSGQSAGVADGVYRIQVGVTPSGGARVLAFDGTLTVLNTASNVSPPIVWCQESDMLICSSTIKSLLGRPEVNDATGFLLQRVWATQLVARKIVTRYMPRPGFVLTRQNTMDPIVGQDLAIPTAVPPSKNDLTASTNTNGGIVLEERLREIVARTAVGLVLRRQSTGGNGKDYVAEAEAQEGMAMDVFHCYQAQMVSASPIGGNSNFLIDMDCIILPAGTSP